MRRLSVGARPMRYFQHHTKSLDSVADARQGNKLQVGADVLTDKGHSAAKGCLR